MYYQKKLYIILSYLYVSVYGVTFQTKMLPHWCIIRISGIINIVKDYIEIDVSMNLFLYKDVFCHQCDE